MTTLDAITWAMLGALWGAAGFAAGYYFGRMASGEGFGHAPSRS